MLITDCIPDTLPHAFTIGTFDGVHLGHRALIQALKATGKPTAILTFATHPLKTLAPEKAPLLITPLPLKLTLLKEMGIGLAIALSFSAKFASTSFHELLEKLPLSHLILGKGSAFGVNREGTEEAVSQWGKANNIPVEYLTKTLPISSQKVREAIGSGDLTLAEHLLGRPHLLYVPAFSTRFSIAGLAMPPDGQYSFSLRPKTAAKASHTFARELPFRYRSGPRFTGLIHEGWIQLSTSFSEPTILAFNPRESHVI